VVDDLVAHGGELFTQARDADGRGAHVDTAAATAQVERDAEHVDRALRRHHRL
jgi:hypothetical protein